MRILINELQNCNTHWEQCIAQQSYFTNEEPKGSQSLVPEDSPDESHRNSQLKRLSKLSGDYKNA